MAGKVLILMGSKADAEVMGEAARVLSGFGIPYTLTVASAHRSPARTRMIVSQAEGEGVSVIIAGAGAAAHLAAQILALSSPDLREKIRERRRLMAEEVAASAEEVR